MKGALYSYNKLKFNMFKITLLLYCFFICAFFTEIAAEDDCQNAETHGSDYTGTVNQTESEIPCQKWSSQEPWQHKWEEVGDHNYCRNPDGGKGVWCYTMDNQIRFEYCDVPFCEDATNTTTTEASTTTNQSTVTTATTTSNTTSPMTTTTATTTSNTTSPMTTTTATTTSNTTTSTTTTTITNTITTISNITTPTTTTTSNNTSPTTTTTTNTTTTTSNTTTTTTSNTTTTTTSNTTTTTVSNTTSPTTTSSNTTTPITPVTSNTTISTAISTSTTSSTSTISITTSSSTSTSTTTTSTTTISNTTSTTTISTTTTSNTTSTTTTSNTTSTTTTSNTTSTTTTSTTTTSITTSTTTTSQDPVSPARSSSVLPKDGHTGPPDIEGHGPLFAIDGKIATHDYGFFHSNLEDYPWLEIKLPTSTEVSSVQIVNRRDCCGERLHNVEVRAGYVSVPHGTKDKPLDVNSICGVYEGPGETGLDPVIKCTSSMMANYVTVQLLAHYSFLQVNELIIQ